MYFIEKTKGTNYLKRFDYALFINVFLLSIYGLVILSSATRTMAAGHGYMIKQMVGLAIGVICAFILGMIDYKDFKSVGIILYFFGIILLFAVIFIGSGKEKWGSNSWIDLGFVSFQPSEFAKITFIIVVAIFLERIKEKDNVKKNIIKLLIYSSVPIILILMEPDTGTGIVYMFIFAVMVFICGLPYRYIFMSIGAFIVSTPLLWNFVLRPHQKERILTFIFPGSDPLNSSMQVDNSIIAIGSGKIWGKHLYQGLQTQNGQVPVRESDFIFSVVGEELGFVGAILMIILIFFILMRCIYIAKNSRDLFGSYLVVGVTAMFTFHFIENIGMCIALLPVTGIPLPFVSYGGTAMIANYIALGIVLSVSVRRKKTIFNNSN